MKELNVIDIDKQTELQKNANEVRKRISMLDEYEAQAALESLMVNYPTNYLQVLIDSYIKHREFANNIKYLSNVYTEQMNKLSHIGYDSVEELKM